jgi:hypothetical protein
LAREQMTKARSAIRSRAKPAVSQAPEGAHHLGR